MEPVVQNLKRWGLLFKSIKEKMDQLGVTD